MPSTRSLVVEPIGLDIETMSRPIDFNSLFDNEQAVELEIGMGKGTFLTDQAKARQDVNFVGLEYARQYWRLASDRLRRNGCANTRTFCAEALFFVRELVGDAVLSVVHVYFPDPWPKKRHHKRRLIQAPFLLQVERVLRPGGRLRIVTDHEEYFQQIEQVVRGSRLRPMEYDRPDSAAEGEFVGSNFERKYRREGRPFYAIAAVRELSERLSAPTTAQ